MNFKLVEPKSVFERLKELIIEQIGTIDNELTAETSFVDDLGMDSLDMVELLMTIENEFDIEIPNSDAEKINTVGEAVEYIQEVPY